MDDPGNSYDTQPQEPPQAPPSLPPQAAPEDTNERRNSEVLENWQRFVQGLLGVLALVGAGFMAHYYAPPQTEELRQQVQQLTRQIQDIQQHDLLAQRQTKRTIQRQGSRCADASSSNPQSQDPQYQNSQYPNSNDQETFAMAPEADARASVAYVCGIYRISGGDRAESFRARVGGTGFVVAPGLLATNRHVAEPWYRDERAEAALRHGATPMLEKLIAYFPGSPAPVELSPAATAKYGDLAVLRMQETAFTTSLHPLPLAHTPPRVGEAVSVIAYPMGVTAMVAKSPAVIYQRLSSHQDDTATAGELAALSLIRPSATFGHIGDVTSEKLIYDAPTARGGSGGPVVNARGEVVGINSAYIEGFSGGTLGISVSQLTPLVESAQQRPTDAATKSK